NSFAFKIAGLVGADLPSKPSDLLVNFAGGAGSFRTIPFSEVLNGNVKKEDLQDKIILVGATASDLRDYLLAPVPGEVMAGVEWHGNVVDNLLLKRYITL